MRSSYFKTKLFQLFLTVITVSIFSCNAPDPQGHKINLDGEWGYRLDSLGIGEKNQWFSHRFEEHLELPGSLTTNNIGNEISVSTPWTGSIVDSSYFHDPSYLKYRQPNNIKIPFWLQPIKYYKGAAWYQNEIDIPSDWEGKTLELNIERVHWESTVWLNDQKLGTENSLGTAHQYKLPKVLKAGKHVLTIRIDNSIKDLNVGINSHSISDHTQSNWNGMVGDISITATSPVHIEQMALFPEVDKSSVFARLNIINGTDAELQLKAIFKASIQGEGLPEVATSLSLKPGENTFELDYPMGDNIKLWDEFNPNLYQMEVELKGEGVKFTTEETFGMREIDTKGTQVTINDKPIFLRGTLESAIFPKTGYPATDVKEWKRILNIAKSFGLNHIRFHSWCPPKAAFIAADELGVYLQVESSSWANQGATIGDGEPLDDYIKRESERMVAEYGNHPSFCFMTYGNEPSGKNHVAYLTDYVNTWKAKDSRRLYTTAAGWPIVEDNDFHNSPDPRIQGWGEGISSIINSQPPTTNYDWSSIISDWKVPTISHEIGQWCVYPNFDEIKKYTGVLKAKNFEIFQERLHENGLAEYENKFLMASGKLQTLCYKADIEAALRTPDFGGFQLLDLHDFPGQGTALVGVLDPFWEEKGYVTAEQYSRFCGPTVPLARLDKRIFLNNENFHATIEIAHFGEKPLKSVTPQWSLVDHDGDIFAQGELSTTDIPIGNAFSLGQIDQELSTLQSPVQLNLVVGVDEFENSWPIWVYPSKNKVIANDNVRVSNKLGAAEQKFLNQGGSLLLSPTKGSITDDAGGDIVVGFSSIFWNTLWTGGQAPHTLGILCDPDHPAFKEFPTQYHSNWQWWDAMSHSNAIRMSALDNSIEPVLRTIDDWFTSESLGLLIECKVGQGKLLISGIDLLSNQNERPAASQLLYSIKSYMNSEDFNPQSELEISQVRSIFK